MGDTYPQHLQQQRALDLQQQRALDLQQQRALDLQHQRALDQQQLLEHHQHNQYYLPPQQDQHVGPVGDVAVSVDSLHFTLIGQKQIV